MHINCEREHRKCKYDKCPPIRRQHPHSVTRQDECACTNNTGDTNTGSLKVSFFGPFYGGYHVIALDPGYRWAMVIGPNTDYLWILARDKQLPPGVREQLVDQAARLGVKTNELIWVEHRRSDS